MRYEAWTAKAVEDRVIEATDTLMISPNVGGGSGSWPEYIPDYPKGMRYRRRPSPGALSRMMECWSWINALPDESDRKLLYSWAWTKVRKGKFLDDFAAREGLNSKTLRRMIIRICQRIADNLNQKRIPCRTTDVDEVSEFEPETASETVTSPNRVNHGNHWRDPHVKLRHDPESPETKALIRKLEEGNARRAKARRSA